MASSVASTSSTNILIALPARPPTPPREASHEVDVTLKSIVLGRASAFDPRLSLQTPPNAHSHTSLVTTRSDPSSSRARKKVEWSAHTDYREPPQYPEGIKAVKSSPLSVVSSATYSKPVKSILKPCSSPNPLARSLTNEIDGTIALTITEMLDSTIKQLAGSDRESKLDAYMVLSRALKASNNLPDRVALQDKMSLFMQFVQRDMTAKSENGSLDTSLINHSLTLLATFLHFPAIASTLTTDFNVFVIDQSIRSFEAEGTPKDVVRHLMQVVAFQNFSAKVMTSERVGRLVTALHRIEDHLRGKSIIMSRLHIYKRLIKQSRNHMAVHLDWLKDMFTDMLSSVKDIRSQAISLGTEAGFALRHEKQLFRKVTELFQTANDGETYIDFYIKRMQAMIKEEHPCLFVPQIWSVVILFLRCPLDRWQHYGPWLTLVQSAFNMTDTPTKQEANFAWNRYVYLSLSDNRVSPKCIGALCQPLLSQLRRKSSPKQQEEAMKLRRVVVGGICNLYYYAFTPRGVKYETDSVWDVAVQPVISQLISLDGMPALPGDGIMQAARLLVGLLDVVTPRIWREDRIMDLPPVKPDELPAIDSKWVRRNCDKVLQLVGPIIQKKFFDLANKDSLVYRLWQALVGSITAASAKDIKVSEDTARFIGCSLGLLSTAVMTRDDELEPASFNNLKLFTSVTNFIEILIDGLGLLPFTEKRVSMTVLDTFEPTSSSSQRLDRADNSKGVIRIPLHHLFILLAAVPPGGNDDDALASFLQSIFEHFLKGKSPKGRLDLAKELLQLLPRNAMSPYGPWLLAANCARAYIDKCSLITAGPLPASDRMNGPELREIVSLLERGLTSHPNLPPQQWTLLFDAVTTKVIGDFGDAGCALVVIEPLSKTILQMPGAVDEGPIVFTVQAIASLFNNAKLPRDKQAVEAARSKLWGAPPTMSRILPFEPFDYLYRLGNHILVKLYDKHFDIEGTMFVMSLLNAMNVFLSKNLSQSGVEVLGKLQAGLGAWVQDEKNRLQTQKQASLSMCIEIIWDHVCSHLTAQERLSRQDLSHIEPLLAAAFKSTHAVILNRTAAAWNAIMKDDEATGYSDSFMAIISSVRSKVDLILPAASRERNTFRIRSSNEGLSTNPSFVASSPISSHPDGSTAAAASRASASKRPMTRRRCLEMTPELHQAKQTKRMSTPRPRHDDSQIQFKLIASSSPLHDESQHLTDRQKEVRERQRQNAVLYSDGQPASSLSSAHSPLRSNVQENAPTSGKNMQESTPKRNKSFEDLISSTPTPRRGQVLQIDDLNDPPSSPPAPRPYPLLSEIRSRSRAENAMESWEFSSPPGSPTENHHAEEEESQPASSVDADISMRLRRSSKRQRVSETDTCKYKNKTVSKGLGNEGALTGKTAEDESIKLSLTTPTTPAEGMVTRARKGHDAPKLEKDSAKGPKSLSRRRSSRRMEADNKVTEKEPETAKSGVASGREDAARHAEKMSRPVHDSQFSDHIDETLKTSFGSHASILVHPDSTSPRSEGLEKTTIETPSPIKLSDTELLEETEASSSRRKRKRVGRPSGRGNKKRRSNETKTRDLPVVQTKPEVHLPDISTNQSDSIERIETRSGHRQRQQQALAYKSDQRPKNIMRQAENSGGSLDSGDTDEEVQSQLVIESNAASQQSQKEEAYISTVTDIAACSKVDETMEVLMDTNTRSEPPVGGDSPPTIMETLRNGLDQLRSASLSRETVYEVEDILMDMKRELFEAERRGRGRTRKRKSRAQ
ncbi:Rap1-interacting factor 1 [Metarhizium rileyi]|uniref:Rap1-interacting factor 1 n=1 Tax=Metarhizium rileyi (strain RCEF 4871) TaxID=1649241 RepID=A0A166VW12_METRR|nr:Rap1-interacting factor 1 [Metarhizium rileyi RCEF 4871]